jgi:hypothetical protein
MESSPCYILAHILPQPFEITMKNLSRQNKKPSPAMMTSEGFFFNIYIISER